LPGGRAGALAGAFSAVSNDAQAVFYNPGGLALISDPEAGVMYMSRGPTFFNRKHFVTLDLFFPADRYGIGGGLLYENRSEEGSSGSSYTLCGILSSGSRVGGRIAVGVGARYLRSVEQSQDASVVGGDLGILLNLSPLFLGFSTQSWQGVLDYGEREETPPRILRFSLAYLEPGTNAPIAVEYRHVSGEEASTLSGGVEIPAVQRKLYLRTGYIRETESGSGSFLLGFGVRLMEQTGAAGDHPIGFELNVYDNLSAGGLRDLRIELRRRRL
jgi:hypothetical protein